MLGNPSSITAAGRSVIVIISQWIFFTLFLYFVNNTKYHYYMSIPMLCFKHIHLQNVKKYLSLTTVLICLFTLSTIFIWYYIYPVYWQYLRFFSSFKWSILSFTNIFTIKLVWGWTGISQKLVRCQFNWDLYVYFAKPHLSLPVSEGQIAN